MFIIPFLCHTKKEPKPVQVRVSKPKKAFEPTYLLSSTERWAQFLTPPVRIRAEKKLTESYCAETSSISHPPLPTESSIEISHLRCILRRCRACSMKI